MTTRFNELANRIKDELGENFDVSFMSVKKNNNVDLLGFRITEGESRMSPTIYFNESDTDDNIVDQVVTAFHAFHESKPADFTEDSIIKLISDPEKIYANVIPVLVGASRNRNLDERDIVYDPYLDMAITYKIKVASDNNGMNTITLTHQIADRSNLDFDKLRISAFANVKDDFEINGIRELLIKMGYPVDLLPDDDNNPMLVVSTGNRTYGSVAMLNEDILNKIHERLDCDSIYILPSSIHEVIAVPAIVGANVDELKDMVSTINIDELPPEEILTDSIYIHVKGRSLEVA